MCPSLYCKDQQKICLGLLLQGGYTSCCKNMLWLGKTDQTLPDATFQKVYFTKSIVGTEFPQQTLGINDFLFPIIAVPTPLHWNDIPTPSCRNFILMSLHGNDIPTKWLGNEIPTNHPWELYTIYNPAPWQAVINLFMIV